MAQHAGPVFPMLTLGRTVYQRTIFWTARHYNNRVFQKLWLALESRVDRSNLVKAVWPK